MTEDLALVYMVAGISSRFGGKIKQFARVGPKDETLIELSLAQALPAGFSKIIFIVGNMTEQPFREMFGNNYKGTPIEYATQKYDESERDRPWGTTDAICAAKDLLTCPFVICNGDDLYGAKTFKLLVKHLKTKTTCATIGYRLGDVLSEHGSVNRGIFRVKGSKLESITEVLDITEENIAEKNLTKENSCSQNIFALYPSTVDLLYDLLVKFKQEHQGNRKKEALLPEHLNNLIKEGKIEMDLYKTPEKWYGVTNPEDEPALREILKKQSS